MPVKHSGFGIASFIIAIIGFMDYLIFIINTFRLASYYDTLESSDPELLLLGSLGIFAFVAVILSIGFGIGGLFHENRKKGFALAGLTISTLMALTLIALLFLSC